MRENDNGTFEVDPGEEITFTVTRGQPPCVASFDAVGWESCTPPVTSGRSTTKTCRAPKVVCNRMTMTVSVSFAPTPQPDDRYAVGITGSSGGSATDTFTPPPNVNAQTFKFHVSLP